MTSQIPPFRQRLSSALADPSINLGIADFQNRWQQRRDEVISQLETQADTEFSKLATHIAERKAQARHDPEVIAKFKTQANKNGIHVSEAKTAQDACELVAEICGSAKLVVKTKSMATEEIFLNEHLEQLGITAIETDLGEWLLQVAGDRPSHLIVPAIHKRRHHIAELLQNHLGREFDPENVTEMARVVRKELRQDFLRAGAGITGGNVLIAETGSLILVTNEGNAGLTTTLPPIHIAVVGIDKLVETVADALDVVRLLAKSATGQVLSSYTQFLSGPTPGQENSEMHVILLDNGRSEMAEDSVFDSALGCIRCGACANVCPPYQVVGGHAFGHVYTGAIGLVTTQFHHGAEAASGPQSLCIQCGACAEVCPAKIPLPEQILEVRARSYSKRKHLSKQAQPKSPLALKLGLRILRSRRATAFATTLAAIATSPLRKDNMLSRNLPGLKQLSRLAIGKRHNWRTLPAPAFKPARRHPELRAVASKTTTGAKTALFIQCVTDRFAPEIAVATLRLLQEAGAEVEVPLAQHCCGLSAIDIGDLDAAKKMALATLDALEGYERVVTPAPSCAVAMAHEYERLFRDDPHNQQRAKSLANRVSDLVTYLQDKSAREKTPLAEASTTAEAPITVHPFCQSKTCLGHSDDSIADLIATVSGQSAVKLPEADVCCGFGGSSSLTSPEIAKEILARKLRNIAISGADTLITDNPGCVLHLRGGAQATGQNIEVLHIAEYLAQEFP